MDRLRKLDCHSVVFVNIPSYANGRNPWKQNKPGFQEQSYSDGKFEVVGFHTLDLVIYSQSSYKQFHHSQVLFFLMKDVASNRRSR